MLDPISRALLNRIFILLFLSLALYQLPSVIYTHKNSTAFTPATFHPSKNSPQGSLTNQTLDGHGFLPKSILGDDPSFLTKDGIPIIELIDNTPSLLPNFTPNFSTIENGKFVSHLDGGYTVVWTVDPELQSRTGKYIRNHRVPYGIFVAENPRNGRLLAFWGSRYSKYDGSLLLRATYPAASLFKIITATDALSQHKIKPTTRIHFHGCLYCIGPAYWHNDRRRDRLEFTVSEALGRSINIVFAKIALGYLSPNDLRDTASRYGFNRDIKSDMAIDQSHADIPDDLNGFAFCSAGFGDVAISPIHAAAIAGALSNDGVMMKPHLIQEIIGKDGKILYQDSPEYLFSVATPTISKTMLSMMRSTVVRGTGHRAFFRWRFNPRLRHILVAGKTGTLTGKNPAGHYVWFIGTASNHDPNIAVAALTIDQGIWTIKGPDIASKGMYTFFNEKHSDKFHG